MTFVTLNRFHLRPLTKVLGAAAKELLYIQSGFHFSLKRNVACQVSNVVLQIPHNETSELTQ